MGGPKQPRASGALRDIMGAKDLPQLAAALSRHPEETTRDRLLTEFFRVASYKNAEEWNRAVRLCEALAILGWGDREPVQAVRGRFFNGNPMTFFVNRHRETRFVDAVWSKRQKGLTMEQGRTSYHASPDAPDAATVLWDHPVMEAVQDVTLRSQRNWIAKNPILVERSIGNCYESTKRLAEDIEQNLMDRLDQNMRPDLYGNAVQYLLVELSFSYFDHAACKCNYVTFDEPAPVAKTELQARLAKMYSAAEISEHGYFARNKFGCGRFQSASGTLPVSIHFPREFSEQPLADQKKSFAKDLERAVEIAAARLVKKKLPYAFDTMLSDFRNVLGAWTTR